MPMYGQNPYPYPNQGPPPQNHQAFLNQPFPQQAAYQPQYQTGGGNMGQPQYQQANYGYPQQPYPQQPPAQNYPSNNNHFGW